MTTTLLIKRHGDAPDAPPLEERTLDSELFTIGSDPAANVVLRGPRVAAEHAIILLQEDDQRLLFNRADGTLLNDESLRREARVGLADGDRLRIGDYVITFHIRPAAGAAPPPPAPEADRQDGGGNSQRNFAAILNSLRTVEDSFNFLIEGGRQNQQRIIIGTAEMPLGWDETGQNLAFDEASVFTLRATVRKERSGVLVEALSPGTVAVNGEPVESARQLSNGDRLVLVPTAATAAQNQAFLVFHEPASLTVLDELLLQKLPPPVPPQSPVEMAETLGQSGEAGPLVPAPQAPGAAAPHEARRVFGYFSPTEVLIFAVGTLLLSVLVFLLLEFT